MAGGSAQLVCMSLAQPTRWFQTNTNCKKYKFLLPGGKTKILKGKNLWRTLIQLARPAHESNKCGDFSAKSTLDSQVVVLFLFNILLCLKGERLESYLP